MQWPIESACFRILSRAEIWAALIKATTGKKSEVRNGVDAVLVSPQVGKNWYKGQALQIYQITPMRCMISVVSRKMRKNSTKASSSVKISAMSSRTRLSTWMTARHLFICKRWSYRFRQGHLLKFWRRASLARTIQSNLQSRSRLDTASTACQRSWSWLQGLLSVTKMSEGTKFETPASFKMTRRLPAICVCKAYVK